jgi:2,3-bisphosphoglycerate-independent phosphoglycerate mutase
LDASGGPVANELARTGRAGLLDFPGTKRNYQPATRLAQLLGVDAALATRLEAGPVELMAEGRNSEDAAFWFRGSLVTLDGDKLAACRLGSMTVEETEALLDSVRDRWKQERFDLFACGPGQFLAVCRELDAGFSSGIPPVLTPWEPWAAHQPLGRRKDRWMNLFRESHEILADHEVNEIRIDLQENPANGLWLWGGGDAAALWKDRPSVDGIMLSQSPSALGLANWLGMEAVEMEDPWAAMEGKKPGFRIARVVELLREHDELTVYVGSPEEWGRYGAGPLEKARALKMLDRFVLSPLMSLLDAYRPFRILLTADGVMSSEQDIPLEGGVPFIFSGDQVEADHCMKWNEKDCSEGVIGNCKPAFVNSLFERVE